VISEAAGITVGSWFAWRSTRPGYELVAGMLIMAAGNDGNPIDYDELERWTREPGSVKASGDLSGQRLVRLLGQGNRRARESSELPGLLLRVVGWFVSRA
jgi:hypothetical protein